MAIDLESALTLFELYGCVFGGTFDPKKYLKEIVNYEIEYNAPKNDPANAFGQRETYFGNIKSDTADTWGDIAPVYKGNKMFTGFIVNFATGTTIHSGETKVEITFVPNTISLPVIYTMNENWFDPVKGYFDYVTSTKSQISGFNSQYLNPNFWKYNTQTGYLEKVVSPIITRNNNVKLMTNAPILFVENGLYVSSDGTLKPTLDIVQGKVALDEIDYTYILNYNNTDKIRRFINTQYNYNGVTYNDYANWEETEPTATCLYYTGNGIKPFALIKNGALIGNCSYNGNAVTWADLPKEWIDYENTVMIENTKQIVIQPSVWETNIPVFKSKEDADNYFNAINNGSKEDIEEALEKNVNENINMPPPINIGDEVLKTELNDGYVPPLFNKLYCGTYGNMSEISKILFSTDNSIVTALTEGLQLYGANPADCVIDMAVYPFDIEDFTTTSTQEGIFFGSFYKELNTAINVVQNERCVIDCGEVLYPVMTNSYLDFEPYTKLYIWLPYIGINQLNISSYYLKLIKLKYIIDLSTGTCKCVLFGNDVAIDTFDGNIANNLSFTSNNKSQYAQRILGNVNNTIKSTVGFKGGSSTLFDIENSIINMSQSINSNAMTIKGSPSPATDLCMPQYPMIYTYTSDVIVPDDLIDISGKKSNSSGKVKDFSGYLKCKSVDLKTNAKSDIQTEIINMLQGGVYV